MEVRRAAMKAIQRLGSDGAIFVPDIILMAEKKENVRLVERMLRRFERAGPTRGHSLSWSGNLNISRIRYACWQSSS